MESENPPRSPLARRWLLNLGLITLVAALAAIVLYTQLTGPEKPAIALTDLRAAEVTRIELAHRGRSKIVLVREAAGDADPAQGWRLQEPVAARVNLFNVQALLALATAPATGLPFAADRLAAYGLDTPPTELRLNGTVLFFGSTHPFEDQVYARNGDRLFLLKAQQYRVATFAYSSFIDTQLLEPGRPLSAVELPAFRLERHDGTWRRQPELAGLSGDDIARFVEQWRHARALTVERSTGGRALRRVRLRFDDGKTLTIDVLAERPELVLYRKDEGLAYHFPAAVAAQLLTLAPAKVN